MIPMTKMENMYRDLGGSTKTMEPSKVIYFLDDTVGNNFPFILGTNKSGPAIGFTESVELVEKAWAEGNYQGLLGFSQGACFAALL